MLFLKTFRRRILPKNPSITSSLFGGDRSSTLERVPSKKPLLRNVSFSKRATRPSLSPKLSLRSPRLGRSRSQSNPNSHSTTDIPSRSKYQTLPAHAQANPSYPTSATGPRRRRTLKRSAVLAWKHVTATIRRPVESLSSNRDGSVFTTEFEFLLTESQCGSAWALPEDPNRVVDIR